MLNAKGKMVRWLAPITVLVCYALWAVSPWGIALEERLGLELLFQWRGVRPPPPNVVVLAINKESAKALGLSPKLYEWSRITYGQAVNQLSRLGARLVIFDVFFEKARDPVGDQAFAEAMRNAGNVLLFAQTEHQWIDLGNGLKADQQYYRQPYEPFARAAKATSPLILPKIPARVNRFFLNHPTLVDTLTLPALANAMLKPVLNTTMGGRTSQETRLYNFYGPPRTLTTIDYETLLQTPELVRDAVQNAVVFVGFSAMQQPDQRDGFYTAFTDENGLDISGVELAATAFANLQDNSWLREPRLLIVFFLVLSTGVASFAIGRWQPPVPAFIAVGVLSVTLVISIYGLFVKAHFWLPLFNGILLQIPLMAGLGGGLRSREFHALKNRLQHAFGNYLPAEEIGRLLAQHDTPASHEIAHSICLVTDAVGYTQLSEKFSAFELSHIMQGYYAAVIGPIREAGGLVSDVTGDGVIALWPHLDRDCAWKTVAPVVDRILRSVEDFNVRHPLHALPTRIGVHAGEIVLGHFGAADHFEYRAMGDLVNTTSRLEGANKQIGTQVLISEECFAVKGDNLRDLGRFTLLGKESPMRLFTPKNNDNCVLLDEFNRALHEFESGNWQHARKLFNQLVVLFPADPAALFYLRYLSDLRQRELILPYLQNGIVCLLKK